MASPEPDLFQRTLEGSVSREEAWATHQSKAIQVRAGQEIYAQPDPLDELYVLLKGIVIAHVGAGKDRLTYAWYRPLNLLGARDLLGGNGIAQDTLIASTSARLLCWPREAFTAALDRDQTFRSWLERQLLRQYCQTVRFMDFARQPLHLRLMMFLSEWRRLGEDQPQLDGMLTHAQLGQLVGAADKTVSRALQKLRADDCLEPGSLAPKTRAEEELGLIEMAPLFNAFQPRHKTESPDEPL